MGFKIGDRVRVDNYMLSDAARFKGRAGTVVGQKGGLLRVEFDDPREHPAGSFFSRELCPAPLRPWRGPKPLTLTGGKARLTVRSGATTRAPRRLRARWRMADDRFPARLPLPAPWPPAAND